MVDLKQVHTVKAAEEPFVALIISSGMQHLVVHQPVVVTVQHLAHQEDFKEVCDALHQNGIRVVLDGVFNHVGRGFGPFQDVLRNRESSPYVNWFYRIAFDGIDCFGTK